MTLRIDQATLRQIVVEELSSLRKSRLAEDVDHEGATKVVTSASKLLKALLAFHEKEPTVAMAHSVTPHTDALRQVLEDMISNPSSYVDKAKVEPRIVKLRAVKDAE